MSATVTLAFIAALASPAKSHHADTARDNERQRAVVSTAATTVTLRTALDAGQTHHVVRPPRPSAATATKAHHADIAGATNARHTVVIYQ